MKRRVRTYLMWVLCVLGVLLVLLAAGAYFVLRSMLTFPIHEQAKEQQSRMGTTSSQETDGRAGTPYETEQAQHDVQAEDAHPLLNETQERALERVGVDPRTLPQTITPELRVCVEQALGSTRMQEILAGDTPGIADALKARGCL